MNRNKEYVILQMLKIQFHKYERKPLNAKLYGMIDRSQCNNESIQSLLSSELNS